MQGNQENNHPAKRDARPAGIILLLLCFASASLYQLLRFSQTLLNWKTLNSFSLSYPPICLAGESLFWALSGGFTIWGIWRGLRWAPVFCGSISLGFSAVYWIKLLVIFDLSTLQTRWPVSLILTIFGLGIILAILNLKSTQAYFGKNQDKIT